MISLIEALNYRCLRYVRQPLKPFHVLVGPNASGKSTFLDVIGFLHDLVTDGLDAAIENRSANFYDLLWRHEGNRFELAIEARIPAAQLELLGTPAHDTVRYQVAVSLDEATNEMGIAGERGLLMSASSAMPAESGRSSVSRSVPESMVGQYGPPGALPLFYGPLTREEILKQSGGKVDFGGPMAVVAGEGARLKKGGILLNRFNVKKSLIGTVASDLVDFPVSNWLKQFLAEGVRRVALDPGQLRHSSPPGKTSGFKPDGSNIPWVVANLERKSPQRHKEWIHHLQTALPDLLNITTIDRPEDRHRYVMLECRDGLRVPSWMVSEGTLRLLALTLPAFIEDFSGIYLIEEPENGIHPLAIETMYQALSWVKTGQVLMATHSPVVLAVSRAEDVLCFTRDDDKGTEVVVGSEHPRLRDWKGEVDLGTLFASGVLG